MPHDALGNLLKPGDRVIVPFVVKETHNTEEACNLTLETVATMAPDHHRPVFGYINSRMTLLERGDGKDFTVIHAEGTKLGRAPG